MGAKYSYLGSTLTSPLQVVNGSLTTVSGPEVLNQSITDILGTPIGSKMFLPEYGSNCFEILFEPDDAILQNLMDAEIQDAITAWEPRVEYLSSSYENDPDNGILNCTINYLILASNQVNSLVYPFSTTEKY